MKFSLKKFFPIVFIVFSYFYFNSLFSTPLNNRIDPFPIYNLAGTDKFYIQRDKWHVGVQLSPFYQHAKHARDKDGHSVQLGDIFGRWAMIPTFFGTGAAPTCKPVTFNPTTGAPTDDTVFDNYKYYTTAHRVLDGKPEIWGDISGHQQDKLREIYGLTPDSATPGASIESDVTTGLVDPAIIKIQRDYTNENLFDVYNTDDTIGFFSVQNKYEKYGLRGQISLDFAYGFGLVAKSGVVDIRQRPTNFENKTATSSASDTDKVLINTYLMDHKEEIAKEFDLDIDFYRRTELEDTHVQLYWNFPYRSYDDNDEHVVTFVPYIAAGVWLPTGNKKNQNKAFSVPTGNEDGTLGVSVEASVGFDFPKMIQINFGGGAVFYETKDIDGYRVHSSKYQAGFIPWKANIHKEPGPLWYVNASFMAPEFLDHFTFYFDYIYMQHLRDKISVRSRAEFFDKSILEDQSKWRDNIMNFGLNYKISSGLDIGLAAQAHYSGTWVYRTYTVLGTIGMHF